MLPLYGNDDRDEILLILVKEFKMMIEDGDLFKNDDIGTEVVRNTFTTLKKKNKLKAIKETFRKYRACLKDEARDKWLKLYDDQLLLATDNYEVDNTYEVEFFKNQTSLVVESLNQDTIESIKSYLQQRKK